MHLKELTKRQPLLDGSKLLKQVAKGGFVNDCNCNILIAFSRERKLRLDLLHQLSFLIFHVPYALKVYFGVEFIYYMLRHDGNISSCLHDFPQKLQRCEHLHRHFLKKFENIQRLKGYFIDHTLEILAEEDLAIIRDIGGILQLNLSDFEFKLLDLRHYSFSIYRNKFFISIRDNVNF